MSGCRSALPLGHHLLVLLFHDVDGSSHAAYKMRASDRVRLGEIGSVPARFWSYPLREAKVINMVVMPLGKTSWMWRRCLLLSACCGGKRLSPAQEEQCRQGGNEAGGRADSGHHPCHHHAGFRRGIDEAVTGQPQVWTVAFWGDPKGLSIQAFAVASSMLTFKNLLARGGNPLHPAQSSPIWWQRNRSAHGVLLASSGGEGGRTPAAPGCSATTCLTASSSHPPLPTGPGRNAEGQ